MINFNLLEKLKKNFIKWKFLTFNKKFPKNLKKKFTNEGMNTIFEYLNMKKLKYSIF